MLFTLHFVRYSIILIIFNRGISEVGFLYMLMFSHAVSFARSLAAARAHARPCALLLWCSAHSLLLSFLRLFLWNRPARLFCSLFAHWHLGGIMKFLGLFPFGRSALPHY